MLQSVNAAEGDDGLLLLNWDLEVDFYLVASYFGNDPDY